MKKYWTKQQKNPYSYYCTRALQRDDDYYFICSHFLRIRAWNGPHDSIECTFRNQTHKLQKQWCVGQDLGIRCLWSGVGVFNFQRGYTLFTWRIQPSRFGLNYGWILSGVCLCDTQHKGIYILRDLCFS